MRKTVRHGIHTALAAAFAAYVVASGLTFVLGTFVPSTVQLARPLACPNGTLSMELGRFAMIGELPMRSIGVMCTRPGEPPVDVSNRTFFALATMLALPLAVLFYVAWSGPSRASKAWARRWQR